MATGSKRINNGQEFTARHIKTNIFQTAKEREEKKSIDFTVHELEFLKVFWTVGLDSEVLF